MQSRKIQQVYPSVETQDGDGVKIKRVAIRGQLQTLDPFLLLDEIKSDDSADYIGGFPPHPHRGFDTITYMLEGAFSHEDHMGNKGHLSTGGAQWMRAGRGVIHSEMPEQSDGKLHGFQLWINLPAKDKMSEPAYQDVQGDEVPELELDNQTGLIRVLAGQYQDSKGPIQGATADTHYFDIKLQANSNLNLPTHPSYTTLIFVYQGSLSIQRQNLQQGHLAKLSAGDELTIATADGAQFLFLSASPWGEPIANYGPFVMNTREEIEQAIADYNAGRLTD